MKRLFALCALVLMAGAASAQMTAPVAHTRDGRYIDAIPIFDANAQETKALVTANVASSSVQVFGGDYIFAQTCTSYGTLTLAVLGPDGVTYQTLLSKTATDTTGGTGLALGSAAVVKATITGTTGCNVLLSRVP